VIVFGVAVSVVTPLPPLTSAPGLVTSPVVVRTDTGFTSVVDGDCTYFCQSGLAGQPVALVCAAFVGAAFVGVAEAAAPHKATEVTAAMVRAVARMPVRKRLIVESLPQC
jgi:hypothetical protein